MQHSACAQATITASHQSRTRPGMQERLMRKAVQLDAERHSIALELLSRQLASAAASAQPSADAANSSAADGAGSSAGHDAGCVPLSVLRKLRVVPHFAISRQVQAGPGRSCRGYCKAGMPHSAKCRRSMLSA